MTSDQTTNGSGGHALPDEQRRGLYAAIYGRRDIRAFRPDPIPDDVLARILDAAHHAGSVGFMQPWDFVVIKGAETRAAVKALFARERQAAACFYDEPRRAHYLSLKLEGIEEAPLNVCVTCDPTRGGEVLGRNSAPETDVYSTCCAVQNLWLAARAEGVGVGWVSILKTARLREILGIPPHVIPVAYLCLGYVDAFPPRPTLAAQGWRQRLALAEVVAFEGWGRREDPDWDGLRRAVTAGGAEPGPGRRGMRRLLDTIAAIGPLDDAAMAAARARQDTLTKPVGSLGRLEELAVRLAGITGRVRPAIDRKAIVVMAGDHGVTAEGVSAYPAAVTPQMVANFLRGGAAISVLARAAGARVAVVDVGVAAAIEGAGLVARKVTPGTRNMAAGPALTRAETLRAIEAGFDVLDEQAADGLDAVALGEMGIGNTTAASAITAALTGLPPAAVTGRGTGLDDAGLARKVAVVERALAVNRPDPSDPLDVLAKVGGLEIAGLVGVTLGAAARRIPVVVDGFIAGAAALLAAELCPRARDYLIAAHVSVEAGHRPILARLGLRPLLDLDLRLGEGSGATLALPLIDAAARLLDEMATFEEAGVATQEESAAPAG
ncbi:MAG: nicotinate-nucleotide--dimethylbenzimidazole phosphoribosyltransferase [Chloroflexota bacterium]|nr:nicotinate-nucleotide--dimethylbenzimidazole phosphoribosyltransferase [Chloroflexota bacterium]